MSNGLYESVTWIVERYDSYHRKELPSITTAMTPDVIRQNKTLIKQQALANAVFIEGGSFTMGVDDCDNYAPDLSSCAQVPTYPVTLSHFSMSKYKITNKDFDTYQADIGQFKNPYSSDDLEYSRWELNHKNSMLPAIVNWEMANGYCQWLGKLTEQPFSLPTEAQWEFVARNRGQHVPFITNTGKIDSGVNAPSYEMMSSSSSENGSYLVAVGQFPPIPLGLYDMSGNGQEWVKDWYSRDKPTGENIVDPQGPAKGYLSDEGPAKVLRPYKDYNDPSGLGVTTSDRYFDAAAVPISTYSQYTARCVINSPTKVTNHD